jgi:hypothetical protein
VTGNKRRDFAKAALYSLAALAVPLDKWNEIAARGMRAHRSGATVGAGEIDAVRQMIATFSQADERFGGGHARIAVVAYLTTDVADYLRGSFASDDQRRAMFSAAAELTYLAGWKTFDAAYHGLAQRYYLKALRLANEADDVALGGFILRRWPISQSTSGTVRRACSSRSLPSHGRKRTPRQVRLRCSLLSRRVGSLRIARKRQR